MKTLACASGSFGVQSGCRRTVVACFLFGIEEVCVLVELDLEPVQILIDIGDELAGLVRELGFFDL